ncbi:LysR family transcriptional regulator [Paenibacillus allorhizosphaerae]|uniref:HTH-type transcriptional activator CmpR n=1 Tax=Paenibacillus allorhizosphaerae TaxID=2849866 RepID=A0ABM8VE63_9BACL|nr:LysR family transcriptional regulator [Paenibacillus allorhizosphaerae]CAG7630318.1 HTH-type transcriptional activator CmpR [Paenibacillus allorhizosphaerae]
MDLVYFQTFREVAQRQSFTRAAEKLGYAQSSVTTQIQKLEKHYGVTLFERFGKRLRLTSSGEALLKITVQMLDLYEESQETIARQTGGTLSIGTIDSLASYYLPPLIEQLRRHFPELAIRLHPGSEAHIIDTVKEGELDLGLLLDDKPPDSSLQCITIKEEPLLLIARPGHPLTQLAEVGLDQLRESEWIMAEESCNYRGMLEKVLRAHDIPYRVGFELGNPEAVKRCVMAGLGLALLPRIVAEEEVRRGELAVLPFAHPDIRLQVQLFYHPKKWISQAMHAFIQLLQSGAPPVPEQSN